MTLNHLINSNFHPIIFTIILVLSLSFTSLEAKEWEKIRDDNENDILIFYRTHKSGNVEFKGITHVESRLSAFVALFADSEKMPKWVYRTKTVTVLKEFKETEVIAYTIHPMPWPLKPRDAVVHSSLTQDPTSLIITIKGKAIPDYIDVDRQFIRIKTVESKWTFKPISKGKLVEITFQGYGEPGGDLLSSIYRSKLFSWLVKLYLWQLPHKTLKNMKTMVKEPEYQGKTFDYIKEP